MAAENNTTISMADARKLYREGNDAGLGYAPYTDEAGDDTIDSAIRCAEEDGWTVLHERTNSEEVAVLTNEDGEVMAIGGDAMDSGAWAVILSDLASFASVVS